MGSDIMVSIIIPVYSVAKYLPNCIERVLEQSYLHTEIILVDDGSPDESGKICDDYAALHSNIKVIHKKNGGASDARNEGIKNASGDYILFLDGDDFWDDDTALARMVERVKLTDSDVLNFSFKKYYEDTKKTTMYFHNVSAMPLEYKEKKAQLKYLSKNNLYLSSPCTKLIRRELLQNDLMFEVGVYSEDIEWSARLIKKAKSLDFVCFNFYCYRQRKDSSSHMINDKKSSDLCKHIVRCIELANSSSNEERKLLLNYAAYQYGTYFIVQAQAVNKQTNCIEKMSKYSFILSNHGNNRKLIVLYLGTIFFGYKNICNLIRFIYGFMRYIRGKNDIDCIYSNI